MSYLVVSRNGEESFNKFSIPDPNPDLDRLSGGPSHGYTPSCVKKSSQSKQYFLSYAREQTNKQTQMHYPLALPPQERG